MKNEFRRKYIDLEREVAEKVAELIDKKGVDSKHRGASERVLKVKGDQQFNIEGGRYLTEITKTELIDNNGYSYNHSCLTLDELCEAVDSVS